MRRERIAVICLAILTLPLLSNQAFALTRGGYVAFLRVSRAPLVIILILLLYMVFSGFMIFRSKNKDLYRAESVRRFGELRIILAEKDFPAYIFASFGVAANLSFISFVTNTGRVPRQYVLLFKLIYWGLFLCVLSCLLISGIMLLRNQLWYWSEKKKAK